MGFELNTSGGVNYWPSVGKVTSKTDAVSGRSVGAQCWGAVSGRSVGAQCRGAVLGRSVGKRCAVTGKMFTVCASRL
jgi:hypothetical protein